MNPKPETKGGNAISRLVSLDAYRGFVMLLMASEGLGLGKLAASFPQNPLLQFLSNQTDHVQWVGCSLWDLIQPSFSFMVGVAMPYSIANRIAKGDGFGKLLGHAIWRSVLLVLLGVFLRSTHSSMTNWTFEDTLSQIGLGYTFLFLVAWTKPRTQFIAACLITFGYWLAFALYPLPGPGFDYASVGVQADWPHLQGFAAHWDKNTNLAAAFDVWFLNLFHRPKTFLNNGGGYLTLSFIPTLATMIAGLIAGGYLRTQADPMKKVWRFITVGITCLALGWILNKTGVAPVVKRIWSPGWVVFSAGWCCLLLAFFYSVVDVKGHQKWAFPLVVVGMNSIAMYCMAHLIGGFIAHSFEIHFGSNFFQMFGEAFSRMFSDGLVLLVLWIILLWMYRRKIFLKI